MSDPFAGERHNRDSLLFARLEPHRRAGGNAEPEPKRLLAVKLKRMIGFKEVAVGADLNRPIGRIGHQYLLGRTAFERLYVSSAKENLPRHDRLGQLGFDRSGQGAPFFCGAL